MSEEENNKNNDKDKNGREDLASDKIGSASDSKLKPRNLTDEMEQSYLDYAMSVIVARALPDVRDGLKPVHRRILYAMNELGLKSSAKYRKSATVVGEVLGKYHPHGDIAVYDSLVRMAQDFSMRYTLINGQGNFGSMDGDSAAAMRYTEAKMNKIAEELLADIDKDTVDFVDNYDGTRKEPSVLPARLPNLLLNGTLGIAVGMATNIPTHNLNEICDAIIKLIDDPDTDIEQLVKIIPGPDFPTGGVIYDRQAILHAYATGKGPIVVRGVADIIEKKGGYQIVITQLPYQVNKADLISRIADLVRAKKLDGISDIRDESDRTEGVRIVIDLKNSSYPKKVLNRIYELTPLQTSFHVNIVALVDGIQPRLLNLKNVLEEYIKHRQNVIVRRTKFDLNKAKERLHILEGLQLALDSIDKIIETIKKSATKEEAHKALMNGFKLTDVQAAAILEMKLSSLAGLERKKVEDEIKEKRELAKYLQSVLDNPKEVLKIIKKDLTEIKNSYGDKRKTKVVPTPIGDFSYEDFIPNEQVFVTLTKGNYIKRVSVNSYRSQNRGGKGIIGMGTKDEDSVEHLLTTNTHNDILFFTDKGRVFLTKVYDLPAASRTAKGQAIVNIIQLAPDEKVTAMLSPELGNGELKYFFMATQKGVVKKTKIDAYRNIRRSGIIAVKLRQDDILKFVLMTTGNDNIIMVTKKGKAIYFKESDVRPMGRSAAGVRGIKLMEGDEVISSDNVLISEEQSSDLLTVLENGYGKRTIIGRHFHTQRRGGSGLKASKVSAKTGNLVEALVVNGDEGDLVLISVKGQVIRMPLKAVKRLGRDTMGVTLMRLRGSDKVSSVAYIVKEKDKEPLKDAKQQDGAGTKDLSVKKTPPPENKSDKVSGRSLRKDKILKTAASGDKRKKIKAAADSKVQGKGGKTSSKTQRSGKVSLKDSRKTAAALNGKEKPKTTRSEKKDISASSTQKSKTKKEINYWGSWNDVK